jgi:hypothetical protein
MKYFQQLLIILLLFITQETICQIVTQKTMYQTCCKRSVEIFPIAENISSNSAFLIDFCELNYKLKKKVKDLIFIAISTTGMQYKLTVLASNFSGTMGQLFLKAKQGIKMGDTISIKLRLKNKSRLSAKIKELGSFINQKKWTIKFKADKIKPCWLSDPNYFIWEHNEFNNRGYSIALNIDVLDNSRTDHDYFLADYSFLPYFFQVKLYKEKFICTSDHRDAKIYNGSCGANFSFEYNKLYNADIKVVDASGNFSNIKKVLCFETKTKY